MIKQRKGYVSPELAQAIIERSNGCCEVCGGNINCQIHHIVKRRKVDASILNLIMLDYNCHEGKDKYKIDLQLKLDLQDKYYAQGKSEEEVRELMGGKIYL